MSIIDLVKKTAEKFIHTGEVFSLPEKSSGESKKAGVFVTVKKGGRLRGCMGSIEANEDVEKEIISSTIAACNDPRFPEIKPDELPDLKYEVNILEKPTFLAESHSRKIPEEINRIDPKMEGIIVESEEKKALLLPDLPGLDSPEKQLIAALKKAGIDRSENYDIYKFETKKHES